MFSDISFSEILVVLLLVIAIFGPKETLRFMKFFRDSISKMKRLFYSLAKYSDEILSDHPSPQTHHTIHKDGLIPKEEKKTRIKSTKKKQDHTITTSQPKSRKV